MTETTASASKGASPSGLFAPNHDEALELVAEAKRYNDWILGRARPYLGTRVLDFGAGIGTFTELFAAEVDEVMAVEPEPHFAELLSERFRDRANVRVVEAEARTLSRHGLDSAFDSAVCFNVLEHIREDVEALVELRRCLRPGGYVLVLVPAHPSLFGSIDRLHGHERRYERHELGEKFRQAGLTPEVIRYVNPAGALGWFLTARVLKQKHVTPRQLALYEYAVPVLRPLDRIALPFGASVWAVASRPAAG